MGNFVQEALDFLETLSKAKGWSEASTDLALSAFNAASVAAGFSFVVHPYDTAKALMSGSLEGNSEIVFWRTLSAATLALRPSPLPNGWIDWINWLLAKQDQAISEADRAWLNSVVGQLTGATAGTVEDLGKIAAETGGALKNASDSPTKTLIGLGLGLFLLSRVLR